MAKVWKVSDAATIALHAMTLLAAMDQTVSTKEIASLLRVSEAHLSKVLQRLHKAGLVKAIRGPRGGFKLERPGHKITLLEVYEAIEGPLTPGDCLFGTPICDGEKCIMGGLLEAVDKQVREYLAGTRLSELADVYEGVNAPAGKSVKRNK